MPLNHLILLRSTGVNTAKQIIPFLNEYILHYDLNGQTLWSK